MQSESSDEPMPTPVLTPVPGLTSSAVSALLNEKQKLICCKIVSLFKRKCYVNTIFKSMMRCADVL